MRWIWKENLIPLIAYQNLKILTSQSTKALPIQRVASSERKACIHLYPSLPSLRTDRHSWFMVQEYALLPSEILCP